MPTITHTPTTPAQRVALRHVSRTGAALLQARAVAQQARQQAQAAALAKGAHYGGRGQQVRAQRAQVAQAASTQASKAVQRAQRAHSAACKAAARTGLPARQVPALARGTAAARFTTPSMAHRPAPQHAQAAAAWAPRWAQVRNGVPGQVARATVRGAVVA